MFARERFALVAGLDSTALFAVASFLPDCPAVSVLDTLRKTVKGKDEQFVKDRKRAFDLFQDRCNGNVKVV